MTIEQAIKFLSLFFILHYAGMRLRRELQMMQQNSYRPRRYLRWLGSDITNPERVVDALMVAMLVGFPYTRWGIYAMGAVGLLSLYKAIKLGRTKSKKPLVLTARAVRIYAVGWVVVMGVVFVAWWWGDGHQWFRWAQVGAMGAVLCAPVVVCAAVSILWPVERAINRRYVNDARRILRSMPRLKVIGITGSYGKTSTKHYLERILSERFSVVMTPGSFNTTLGVVRTIREHLKPYTEVFIVEMGAKQRGDIAEICDLVHPKMGILTSVGEQHLESFRTIENVQRTKFELIDSLPEDGVAILNDDFEYIASRPVEGVEQVFRYTSRGDDDSATAQHRRADHDPEYRITDVKYGRGETSFRIEGPTGEWSDPFTTRLAGVHNLSNILAGYIAGRTLGMTDAEMRYAIASIEQVEHRLNIKHTPGGVTIIDDAFNSNPHGAAMALDVLAGFGDGGRRIVVTPGMIELGERQEHYNRELGRQMARTCDIAVVVGEYNREAILSGLADEGFPTEAIYAASDFADASRWVGVTMRAGDTILYENDLPDTFK